jgi:glycogen(starch) synthase
LVTTVHATEAGRHQGWLPGELSRSLHTVEWRLTNASQRVITCSGAMKGEAQRLFDLDADRVVAVPNGIDLAQWRTTATEAGAARSRYAAAGPLLVHTGRLEWEKGMHTVLAAMPTLRRRLPGVRLVVAGRGGKEAELNAEARRLRLGRAVQFVGWLPEGELHAVVAAADVAIVPSRYEPFGLVALEAAALGTAVIVSDTGGLAEFADDGRRALLFPPGDHRALADAVCRALADADGTRSRVRAARESLEQQYSWPRVARLTDAVYDAAIADGSGPGPRPVRAYSPPPAGTRVLPAVG